MNRIEAREHNKKVAARLCKEHGCDAKRTAEHFDQIVNRAWNPHPGAEFKNWWSTQPEAIEDGLDAIRARNTSRFVDRFKEARRYGIA